MPYLTIEDAVGNTPLVQIRRMLGEHGAPRNNVILAKLEIKQEALSHPGPTYVILGRSQADYARYTGVLSTASISAPRSALAHDASFRLVYQNGDAIVFERQHTRPEAIPWHL